MQLNSQSLDLCSGVWSFNQHVLEVGHATSGVTAPFICTAMLHTNDLAVFEGIIGQFTFRGGVRARLHWADYLEVHQTRYLLDWCRFLFN